MEIIDSSKKFKHSRDVSNHAPFFPRTIFCVIAGSTGSGKTNLMLNLLLQDKILDYGSVHIYSPTLHQSSHQYLQEYFNNINETIKSIYGIKLNIANFYDGDEEIRDPKELDPKISHIMIFDDVMNADQTQIKD